MKAVLVLLFVVSLVYCQQREEIRIQDLADELLVLEMKVDFLKNVVSVLGDEAVEVLQIEDEIRRVEQFERRVQEEEQRVGRNSTERQELEAILADARILLRDLQQLLQQVRRSTARTTARTTIRGY